MGRRVVVGGTEIGVNVDFFAVGVGSARFFFSIKLALAFQAFFSEGGQTCFLLRGILCVLDPGLLEQLGLAGPRW